MGLNRPVSGSIWWSDLGLAGQDNNGVIIFRTVLGKALNGSTKHVQWLFVAAKMIAA
jgi:hypothetical protein